MNEGGNALGIAVTRPSERRFKDAREGATESTFREKERKRREPEALSIGRNPAGPDYARSPQSVNRMWSLRVGAFAYPEE